MFDARRKMADAVRKSKKEIQRLMFRDIQSMLYRWLINFRREKRGENNTKAGLA